MAKAKTNTEIIRDSVQHIFSREQIHTLAAAHFSAETIAAHASGIIVLDKDGNELDPTPDAELILVSGLFHTFQEWKKDGLSVKKGEKAAFSCQLWRWTDKPNAAARKAAEEAGEEVNPDPHFYKTLSHLFFIDQVERRPEKAAPAKLNTVGYNKYLSACRKAGNKNPLSLAAWSAEQVKAPAQPTNPAAVVLAAVEHHEVNNPVELPAPAKKPAGKKKAATKAPAKKAAKPAPVPAPVPAAEPDFAALAASILF